MSLQEFVPAPRFEEYSERFKDFPRLDVSVAVRPAHIGANGIDNDQAHFADLLYELFQQIDVPECR